MCTQAPGEGLTQFETARLMFSNMRRKALAQSLESRAMDTGSHRRWCWLRISAVLLRVLPLAAFIRERELRAFYTAAVALASPISAFGAISPLFPCNDATAALGGWTRVQPFQGGHSRCLTQLVHGTGKPDARRSSTEREQGTELYCKPTCGASVRFRQRRRLSNLLLQVRLH